MALMSDPVNHPAHYHSSYIHESCGTPIECIDIVRHMDFDTGNAVKYCWRAGKKGDTVEDLEKAVWYLNDRISELKRAQAKAEHAPTPHVVVEGIQFSILTAEVANQNWNAFNREPFYLNLVPAGQIGDPNDVGRLVAYLCSDHASYVSGSVMTIDGGLTSIPAG